MGLSIYISSMCMYMCVCMHTKSGNPTWGEQVHRPLSPWWEYPVASGVMEMGSSSQEQINITWKYKRLLKDLAETRAKTGHAGYSEYWGQTPSLGSGWHPGLLQPVVAQWSQAPGMEAQWGKNSFPLTGWSYEEGLTSDQKEAHHFS